MTRFATTFHCFKLRTFAALVFVHYSQGDVLGGSLEISDVELGFGVAARTATVNFGALVIAPLDVDLDSSGTVRLNGGRLAAGSIDSHDLSSQRLKAPSIGFKASSTPSSCTAMS